MSADLPAKSALIDDLQRTGQRLSTATLLFHQAVADRLGLHLTDHKCLGLLAATDSMTAGALARAMGLTTGAITGAIDRLEAAGFVRRDNDPSDRRRVIIRVVPKRLADVVRLFEPFAAEMARLGGRYTERELATILDFLNRSCEVLGEATTALRQKGTPSRRQNPGRPLRRTTKAKGEAT